MRILHNRSLHYLLLIAALPVLGFEFGIGNQVEQFTLIRRLADPAFAAHDFYVDSAAVFGPRYYYSLTLAWLTQIASLPTVILVLTFVSNLVLAGVSFDAARRHLNASAMGGAIAALLVVVNSGFALGLAAYLRFESFQPASPAIALALAGFSLLLAGRRIWAAAAFAASALAHPLIGVETAVVAYGACALAEALRTPSRGPLLSVWLRYVPSGVLLASGVAAAWVLPGIGHDSPGIPDAEFFSILAQFRSPHHYLAFEMPRMQFLHAGIFVLVTGWLIGGHVREAGRPFAPMALGVAAALVVFMCAASVLLVDLMHLRVFTTAQLFRTLLIVKWIGLLFFAARAETWLRSGQPLAWIAAVAPILVAGEAQAAALAASVTTMEAAQRLRRTPGRSMALAGLLVLLAATAMAMGGEGRDFGRAIVGVAVLIACFGFAQDRAVMRIGAAVLVAALIGVGVANRRLGYDLPGDVFEPTYSFDDIRTPAADIARWVRLNTRPDTIWMTPPDFETFRLLAERAIIVDFTSVPFQDQALREWRQRIRMTYGDVEGGGFTALRAMTDNYKAGDPVRLRTAALRYGATHAVLYAETPWVGPVLHQNDGFKVVVLSDHTP